MYSKSKVFGTTNIYPKQTSSNTSNFFELCEGLQRLFFKPNILYILSCNAS